MICGTGMLVFLSNSWCVKHAQDEASHVCALYVRVCEKGRLFLCFIVVLTNLLCRLNRLLSRATKKLHVYEESEMESQLSLQGEMKNNCSEMVSEDGRLRTKVSSGLFGVFLVIFFCWLGFFWFGGRGVGGVETCITLFLYIFGMVNYLFSS